MGWKPKRTGVWAVAVVLSALALPAVSREVTVKLRGGEEISGELIDETATTITIRVEGGARRLLPRDQLVGPIRERLGLDEQYKARKRGVADNDAKARLAVARWLYEYSDPKDRIEAWNLAKRELDAILAIDPKLDEARFMREAVETKLKDAAGAPAPAPGQTPPGTAESLGPVEPLTNEQINLMRVLEVRLDTRPRVVIPRKVVDEFLEKYTRDPIDPAMERYRGRDGAIAFKRLEPHQQLAVIFELRAREYYDQIKIVDEPDSLLTWRKRVHLQYVSKYCGACHRQDAVGGLDLMVGVGDKDVVAYTNLIRLARMSSSGAPMISRAEPERSVLFQDGLPRQEAAIPHPDVKNFRPYFRGRTDDKFTSMLDWVESLYTEPKDLLSTGP